MRGFFLGLSVSVAFVAGTLTAVLLRGAPLVSTASAAERDQYGYLCFEEGNVDQIAYKANAAGARGWEMVSAAPGNSGAPIWCFRQKR